jgi:hypothetical protein
LVGKNDIGINLFGNTDVRFIGNESFHPTHIGHAMIASAIEAQLGDHSILDYRKCALVDGLRCPSGDGTAPAIPSYFTLYGATTSTQYVVDAKSFDSIYQINGQPGVQQGQGIQLQQPTNQSGGRVQLAPNQDTTVTMYSTPRQVGTLTTNDNGETSGSITIPADVEDVVDGRYVGGSKIYKFY